MLQCSMTKLYSGDTRFASRRAKTCISFIACLSPFFSAAAIPSRYALRASWSRPRLGKRLTQQLPSCGVRRVERDRLPQMRDRRAGVAGPEILEAEPKAKQRVVLAALEQFLQLSQSGGGLRHRRISSPLVQSTRRMG